MAQEASKDGYIQLHRKLLTSFVFTHPYLLKLWIYCLLKASYKPRQINISGEMVDLLPGQFVWGRGRAAKVLNEGLEQKDARTERTWENLLKQLEKQGMIRREVKWHFTRVTIVNHRLYQQGSPDEGASEEKLSGTSLVFTIEASKTDYTNPYQMYEKAYAHTMTEIIAQSIAEWINDFDGNAEIVSYAIEEAGRNAAQTPRYFMSILKSWKKQGIRTLEEAKHLIAEFETEKERRLTEKIRHREEEKQMEEPPKVSLYNWLAERSKGT